MIRRTQRASHYGSVALPQGRDGAGLKLDGGDSMNMRINMGWTGACALALVLSLQGCGGEEDTTALVTQIPVSTPADLAQESADDYNENVNGLITAATLKRWKDDWLNQRPAGITGKLIILQVSAGPTSATNAAYTANAAYIKPNGTNVFTYLSPSSEWTQVRTNGVIETVQVVPDGPSMDALFKKYNIDPQNDMIVAAMGTGSNPNAMAQGRIWYALRYWGVDKKNLAILNGGNSWLSGGVQTFPAGLTAADFLASASSAPGNGRSSVKDLLVDNTILQATVGDMLRILPATNNNVTTDGVLIWDARSLSQYSAGEMVEYNEDTNSDLAGTQSCATAFCTPVNPDNYMWSFQNNSSRQGHPFGTLQVQYTHFLDPTKGFSYRPKAFLAKLVNGGVTTAQDVADGNAQVAGIGFVDASYGLVGEGNAYQPGDIIYAYCETTFRAMITGVASAVILGKPTRFYDGAMVEWNSLTYTKDALGNDILPSDSPWRTDVKSFFRLATSPSLVAQRFITDAYAPTSEAVIRADKLYKFGDVIPTAGTGGQVVNPCGG
jgi:thiosulfate/3-mercaptopyruvate sulfurtransferase